MSNPFEDFIGSIFDGNDDEDFITKDMLDMDGNEDLNTCNNVHPIVNDILEELPHPMESGFWETEMTPFQHQFRSCLTQEFVARVFEPNTETLWGAFDSVDKESISLLVYVAISTAIATMNKVEDVE